MDRRKIVVVVEEVQEARSALLWALNNLLRYGDSIVLLHLFPVPTTTTSTKKLRLLRLKGFHLALSFNDLCLTFPHARVEIVVTRGDQDGNTVASIVRDIGASVLVVGLHDHSFLYKSHLGAMALVSASSKKLQVSDYRLSSFSNEIEGKACRYLPFPFSKPRIKRLCTWMATTGNRIADNPNCKVLAIKQSKTSTSCQHSSINNLEFSQIETAKLSPPPATQPKLRYQILPSPFGIIWRGSKRRSS